MAAVTIMIGTDVSYAIDQEFGPYGKPYLRPALDENEPAILKEIGAVLKLQIAQAVK